MPTKAEKAASALREDLATDLLNLGPILVDHGLCGDPGPLYRAASECLRCSGDDWRYSISGLILQVGDGIKGIPPLSAMLACRLDVTVVGLCSRNGQAGDPLRAHAVEIETKLVDSSGHTHVQTWHFDRHIGEVGTPQPELSHPRYHFTYGGRALERHLSTKGFSHFDGILLLDTPRIASPPFDGSLAIDFVISNFAGGKCASIRSKTEYLTIIAKAQRRLWHPYVAALNTHWDKNAPLVKVLPWKSSDVWPQICA
jgi:hypothetical protein